MFDPFTTKISLVILLTVCHTVLVMFVWRIWYWINLYSLSFYFSLFSSVVCYSFSFFSFFLKAFSNIKSTNP